MSDAIHIREDNNWSTLCGKPLAEQKVDQDTPSIYGPAIGWEGNATCKGCLEKVSRLHRNAYMRAGSLRAVAERRLELLRAADGS